MSAKDIDLTLVNPFLVATNDVFKRLFNLEMKSGEIIIKDNPSASYEIAIIVGISGKEYTGVVVYSMKKDTAMKFVENFDKKITISDEDDSFVDALGELGNIILGNALSEFCKHNIFLSITTPSVIIGQAFEIHLLNQTTLSTDIMSSFGILQINVAIKHF